MFYNFFTNFSIPLKLQIMSKASYQQISYQQIQPKNFFTNFFISLKLRIMGKAPY